MVVVRWMARIGGLLIVGLILFFLIGEGFDPTKLNGMELAMSAALATALLGMVALWRWECVGGAFAVGGMLAFYFINLAASGRFPGGFVFPLFFVPGILALARWWLDERRQGLRG